MSSLRLFNTLLWPLVIVILRMSDAEAFIILSTETFSLLTSFALVLQNEFFKRMIKHMQNVWKSFAAFLFSCFVLIVSLYKIVIT